MAPQAEEVHLTVSCGGFETINRALSWALQTCDRRFEGASMMKMQVEQILITTDEPGAPWREEWSATISGMVQP